MKASVNIPIVLSLIGVQAMKEECINVVGMRIKLFHFIIIINCIELNCGENCLEIGKKF